MSETDVGMKHVERQRLIDQVIAEEWPGARIWVHFRGPDVVIFQHGAQYLEITWEDIEDAGNRLVRPAIAHLKAMAQPSLTYTAEDYQGAVADVTRLFTGKPPRRTEDA